MRDILSMVETYADDQKLFHELGLKTFSYNDQNEHLVGKVTNDDGYAEIYIMGMPAQFWRFIIHCNETGKSTEISTGSGRLVDYWPFAELIMQGMINVTNINTLHRRIYAKDIKGIG